MPIINHYAAIELRIRGSGILNTKLLSMDDITEEILIPLTMQSATNRQATRLSNFTEERARVRIWTENIDETLRLTELTIYVKPRATSYPG